MTATKRINALINVLVEIEQMVQKKQPLRDQRNLCHHGTLVEDAYMQTI